jgi:NADPH:quinone reductase-like Zn-dependent oxidoreductase
MKAAVVTSRRRPPAYRDFAVPALAQGEVMVRVQAAGLHPIVKTLAADSAARLPMVAGLDGTGLLEDGLAVYFTGVRPPFGAMAEFAPVPASQCLALPAGLEIVTAAAAVNPGLSAWLALTWRARLAEGERVLVLGATGVAGRLAVQVARRLGARHIAGAGRDDTALVDLRRLGADSVISLTGSSEKVAGRLRNHLSEIGTDIVIDYLWGPPTEILIAALEALPPQRAPIRLVQVGQSAGPTMSLPAQVMRRTNLQIIGSGSGSNPPDTFHTVLPEFVERLRRGEFDIAAEVAPLADVEAVWSLEQRGRRLVLSPGQPVPGRHGPEVRV